MSKRSLWIRRLGFAGGVLLATITALLPWWRNHAYLRDFYDYGLVMSGVGRIAAGERPYQDFVTPIQAGTFIFNGWAERAGDGTYQAMTRGAAVLIALTVVGLALLFARRWPAWIAIVAAAAIATMSASQHTIVWHNAVGVLCLVVVAWAAALAPVARRGNWFWVALAAAALFVGGINKLNAQLVALACAAAWMLRALFRGESGLVRAVLTLAGWLVAGIVAPIALELAWTGADWPTWWHNVVVLPFSSRAGDFVSVLRPEFYLKIHHDYYGGLSLPWLGALGLAASLGTLVVAWRAARGWSERAWALLATLFAAGAGAGLLATNYEIAWIALAAWLGLLAALWAGFALPARGVGFHVAIVAPLLLLGVAAWESAWRGQRSQFGYSLAPRDRYVDGGTVHAEFSYLRGTRLPPETAQTMNEAMQLRWKIPALFRPRAFYGPGLEWLERVWPAVKVRGLPLWMHDGTSYSADEREKLADVLRTGGVYDFIFVSEPRNHWPAALRGPIAKDFSSEYFGSTWVMYRARPPSAVATDPLAFVGEYGGNVDALQLFSTARPMKLSDGRSFLGANRGMAKLTVAAASYRMTVEAVVRRTDPTWSGPIRLRFGAFELAEEKLPERGSFDVELPAGVNEQIFARDADPGGVPMLLTVTVPPELAGRIEVGWRGPRFNHTLDGPAVPPLLRPGASLAVEAGEPYKTALVASGAPPAKIFLRQPGEATPDGVTVAPGGEIWLRVAGGMAVDFTVQTAGQLRSPALPVVRIVYYKGGRLEVLRQDAIRSDEAVNFHAWSAEADGWIALLVDRNDAVPPLRVRAAVR